MRHFVLAASCQQAYFRLTAPGASKLGDGHTRRTLGHLKAVHSHPSDHRERKLCHPGWRTVCCFDSSPLPARLSSTPRAAHHCRANIEQCCASRPSIRSSAPTKARERVCCLLESGTDPVRIYRDKQWPPVAPSKNLSRGWTLTELSASKIHLAISARWPTTRVKHARLYLGLRILY